MERGVGGASEAASEENVEHARRMSQMALEQSSGNEPNEAGAAEASAAEAGAGEPAEADASPSADPGGAIPAEASTAGFGGSPAFMRSAMHDAGTTIFAMLGCELVI